MFTESMTMNVKSLGMQRQSSWLLAVDRRNLNLDLGTNIPAVKTRLLQVSSWSNEIYKIFLNVHLNICVYTMQSFFLQQHLKSEEQIHKCTKM